MPTNNSFILGKFLGYVCVRVVSLCFYDSGRNIVIVFLLIHFLVFLDKMVSLLSTYSIPFSLSNIELVLDIEYKKNDVNEKYNF